jgi:hypothetical protein
MSPLARALGIGKMSWATRDLSKALKIHLDVHTQHQTQTQNPRWIVQPIECFHISSSTLIIIGTECLLLVLNDKGYSTKF